MGGWVRGWVGGWMIECVRGYGCLTFRTFVFWTHGGFTALDDGTLRTNWTHVLLLYVICCTAVTHGGWVDRFVGVTAVLRTAVLL